MQQNGLTIWESPQLAMKIKKKKEKRGKMNWNERLNLN